jgi:hypothetical protein
MKAEINSGAVFTGRIISLTTMLKEASVEIVS